MKWLALLFWDPKVALDWCDAKGHLDHGKVVADLVTLALLIAVMIVAITTLKFPPIGLAIVLIAGAMGQRVFMAFLRSRVVTSKENIISGLRPDARPLDHPDDEPS